MAVVWPGNACVPLYYGPNRPQLPFYLYEQIQGSAISIDNSVHINRPALNLCDQKQRTVNNIIWQRQSQKKEDRIVKLENPGPGK